MDRYQQVLQFWFGGTDEVALSRPRGEWFRKDDAFDAAIRQQFGDLPAKLLAGDMPADAANLQSCLAALIATDQFSRNLHRGSAAAFECDSWALALAKRLLAAGLDQRLPPVARWFVYLPLEHSENLADQHEAVCCFESLPVDSPGRENVIDYAHRHRAVIEQFGRFPHRNAALARPSTAEELHYLAQPGSGF